MASNKPLRTGDLNALARALVPYVREVVAERTAELTKRVDEIESVVRAMVEARSRDG